MSSTAIGSRSMSRWSNLGVAAGLALCIAAPATAADDDSTVGLRAAEDAYTRAVVGRDVPALAGTLSDDLIYIHATGAAETKAQYLKGTADGGFLVVGVRIVERRANLFGTIGVTYGTIAYNVGNGENFAGYLAVYRREHGRWLLLRWQNAKRPKP